MEHWLFYSVIGLAVLGLILALARLPGRGRLARRPEELADRTRKRREREKQVDADQLTHRKAVLQRELKQVPIPWGWPGSELRREEEADGSFHGVATSGNGSSLKRWIDRLVAEKRTVEDDTYRSRREAALRAMLEDRFGRSPQAAEMKFTKVKPPRLRDPDRPYDQMDNFPGGRTEKIVGKLSRQPGKVKAEQTQAPLPKTAGLGDIKKPWGW